MGERRKACWKYTGIIMFFLSGSIVPVLNSIILKNNYPWRYGLKLPFNKPWFMNMMMFAGMALFSIPYLGAYIYHRYKKTGDPSIRWELFRSTSIPSLLYIVSSVLQNYALIYMPVTVWQVFFGFQVLFTTLFAVTIRKQQLFLVDWLGLFISVLGISFTGVAGILRGISNPEQSVTTVFFMCIIAIFSHGIKSFETILEETIMHDNNITGTQMTAYEGLWGFYLITFIFLPVINILPPTATLSLYENSIESFEMVASSTTLLGLCLAFLFFVTLFSYYGLQVTELSTAIHRNLYETIRPLVVWALSTMAHYIAKSPYVGENLDRYSILEMVGFGVSLVGSMIYNRVWRFGCFIYVEDEPETRTDLSEEPLLRHN